MPKQGIVRERHSKEIGGTVVDQFRMLFSRGAEATEALPISTPRPWMELRAGKGNESSTY
jgi:hypothetical protein